MIIFLLTGGMIGVLFILFFRSAIAESISGNNVLVKRLQKLQGFQKSYLAGFMLFLVNAILFMGCLLILYGLTLVFIPYVHFIVMIIGIVLSIWFWMEFNIAWIGSKKGRIILASIGSSFYFGLTILFVYMYVGIEPYYPGEDTFMRALGLALASIVTAVACITCFVITGFSNRNINQGDKYSATTEARNSQ
ncbi:hypothetical protein [Lysinibacillus sp. SGAir0095]|uniref:hypothetical protein n=1 Tax=Lysinibacillus sp. SGAir0095 TaxID=2070463 RepID=UPI0010CCF860|nr:hypothetical protein [Lysinibacillus sp. SGAir0095]QCR31316.1 hypothetical protein C1N55_03690 [Lysinibacillus sp. SGAir0095]